MEGQEVFLLGGLSIGVIVVALIELVLKPALPRLEGQHWLWIAIGLTLGLGIIAWTVVYGMPTTYSGLVNMLASVLVYALALGKTYDEVKAAWRGRVNA